GSASLKLAEVNEASSIIQTAAHEDANIIFGAVLNDEMKDEVKITVIATGFREDLPVRRERTLSAATISRVATSPLADPELVTLSPESRAEMEAEAEQFISASAEPVRVHQLEPVPVMPDGGYDRDDRD